MADNIPVSAAALGTGRRFEREPATARFPLRAAHRAPLVRRRPYVRLARFTGIDNQGRTGTCVGGCAESMLVTAPTIHKRRLDQAPTRLDLYRLACDHDEWPENDGGRDLQFGSSIRGLMRGLRAAGFVEAFHWGETVDDCADWLVGEDPAGQLVGGGLCMGVNWYESFYTPDREGFIRIGQDERARSGHAFYIDEYDDRAGWFGFPNQWGYGWGRWVNGRQNGRGRIDGETLARLLAEWGEAAAAVERRVAA